MEQYKINANEQYFRNVINLLGKRGAFVYKELNEVLKCENGKLCCTQRAYDNIKNIVSADFLTNYFIVK